MSDQKPEVPNWSAPSKGTSDKSIEEIREDREKHKNEFSKAAVGYTSDPASTAERPDVGEQKSSTPEEKPSSSTSEQNPMNKENGGTRANTAERSDVGGQTTGAETKEADRQISSQDELKAASAMDTESRQKEIQDIKERLAVPESYSERDADEARLVALSEAELQTRSTDPGSRAERSDVGGQTTGAETKEADRQISSQDELKAASAMDTESRQKEIQDIKERLAVPESYSERDADEARLVALSEAELQTRSTDPGSRAERSDVSGQTTEAETNSVAQLELFRNLLAAFGTTTDAAEIAISPSIWSDVSGRIADAVGGSKAPDWVASIARNFHDGVADVASNPNGILNEGKLGELSRSGLLGGLGAALSAESAIMDAKERKVGNIEATADGAVAAIIDLKTGPVETFIQIVGAITKAIAPSSDAAAVTSGIAERLPSATAQGLATYGIDSIGTIVRGNIGQLDERLKQASNGDYGSTMKDYANAFEGIAALMVGDRASQEEYMRAAEQGDFGSLPKIGDKLGDWIGGSSINNWIWEKVREGF